MTLRFSAPKVLGLPGLPVWMDRPKIASIMKQTGWDLEKTVAKLRSLSMAQIEAEIRDIEIIVEGLTAAIQRPQKLQEMYQRNEDRRVRHQGEEEHETREETCLPIDTEPLSGEPIEVGEEQSSDLW